MKTFALSALVALSGLNCLLRYSTQLVADEMRLVSRLSAILFLRYRPKITEANGTGGRLSRYRTRWAAAIAHFRR
jgi:hypothetical protein